LEPEPIRRSRRFVGIVVAVVFALAAIVLRIPAAIVIAMSAFWGASAIVGGSLVLFGRIGVADLRNGSVDVVIGESTVVFLVWLALAAVGIAVQWMTRPEVETQAGASP